MKKLEATILVLVIMGYSIVAFTYMHSNFPTKEVFQMVCEKLSSIDAKLDRLIEREVK